MSHKICVYAICKNESAFVHRWMDSMEEADLVVVVDTGSHDNTAELLRGRNARVYSEEINPWRFDVARNISLSHVPEDVEICICTDLDEVFDPGWREKLESAWEPSCTQARYLFTSDFNPDKTPRKQFFKEKIHRRKGFKWVHPVHEILEYSGSDPERILFVPGLMLNHYPDLTKPRSQYLPLLELSARENPMDDQTIFWLGREYLYRGFYDSCIETLIKHLKLPTATWDEERCASMRFIAIAYQMKGNISKAKSWLYKAIAQCPHIREPYLAAAKLGYTQSDWILSYAMVKNGLKITRNSGSYLVEPEAWGMAFYDFGAISAYCLGLFGESLEYAVKALEMEPENRRLKENLRLIEAKLRLCATKGESSV